MFSKTDSSIEIVKKKVTYVYPHMKQSGSDVMIILIVNTLDVVES